MKKIIFGILILFSVACNSENEEKSKQIVSETNENPYPVLDSLSKEIVKDPNNSNNYYRRGLYFFNENELDDAIADMKRAIIADSTVSEYYFQLGNLYYQNKYYKKAFEAYQKTVELENDHVGAILELSRLELVLKNYQLALDMVNKALKIDPMNPNGYHIKGFIYLDAGDTTKAVSSFRTAIEVNPDFYESYVMLGKIFASKNHSFAGNYYDQALRIKPHSIEALYDKGVYLQDIENYTEAYSIYDTIIAVDSTSYFAYYNRGYIMLVSDSSYNGAIREFEKSIKYYPYYYQAYYNIGLCYENMDDYDKAREYYQKSLDLNKQYDLAAKGLGRLLKQSSTGKKPHS